MSCITIVRKENLMNLGDRLIEAMGCYGSIFSYEVQTGIIAEPTTTSRGNGHAVVVHNETEERDFLWIRTDLDTKWAGCEFL